MLETIKTLVAKHYQEVVSLRRHFRANPELGGQEFGTQDKIIVVLQSLGLNPKRMAGTGVVADLKGTIAGDVIAIRADIDALPMADECDQSYRSLVPGICHACGHDGHTAMLLGVAMILSEMKEELRGTVRFIFQPREEKPPGGALDMIKEGALDGVSKIIGAHLWQPEPIGTIGVVYDRMMASASIFRITVHGHGGHSSAPHETVNPILVGTEIIMAMNKIASYNIDPRETVALSVGIFQSGEAENIIPATAQIKGTLRCYDDQLINDILDRIERICQGICLANNASFSLERIKGYPALINNPDIVKVIVDAGTEVLGADGVKNIKPTLGGEDFAYYLHKLPGAFVFIGAGNAEKGIVHPHHHPRFDIDEQALAFGMEIMSKTAIKLLNA